MENLPPNIRGYADIFLQCTLPPHRWMHSSAVCTSCRHLTSILHRPCTSVGWHVPQIFPFHCRIWTPANAWFLGSIRVCHADGISIGLVVRVTSNRFIILARWRPSYIISWATGGTTFQTPSWSVLAFMQGSRSWLTYQTTQSVTIVSHLA